MLDLGESRTLVLETEREKRSKRAPALWIDSVCWGSSTDWRGVWGDGVMGARPPAKRVEKMPSRRLMGVRTDVLAISADRSTGSNNTYVMSSASKRPTKERSYEPYMPKIITTVGQRPACLVNASVTYVGNDEIYAFGGFDQYSDEVYNHVLKLNLSARQWSLVDNYGDIPGVRMGHTACLWQGDKLLVYGGENEHRHHLSDVIIFDLKTAHWTQPELSGPTPRGRARHAAVIHNDKLFITGGMTGNDNSVLGDICYLDLKTWTWSRTWYFVPRYDHSVWVYNDRLWVSGGVTEEMERTGELWWLDLKGAPAFEGAPAYDSQDDPAYQGPPRFNNFAVVPTTNPTVGTTTYAANSSSVQTNPGPLLHHHNPPLAPGAISSIKFVSGPNVPPQNLGFHFHVFSSGCLLDFVTPASVISTLDTSLSALDLDATRWQRLADGKDLFNPNYRWHYCCLNEDGTHAWLLGCPNIPPARRAERAENNDLEETLSDVLHIDLRKLGLLGNKLSQEAKEHSALPSSDSTPFSHLSGIGADLARTFDTPPEMGSGTDFIITALPEPAERSSEMDDDDSWSVSTSVTADDKAPHTSKPIHVHRFILSARWPHFARLYNAQMSEFHSKRMHIPEPYSAVKAFLSYLYTDSINATPSSGSNSPSTSFGSSSMVPSPSLEDVAGMLVMSNIYGMPRLHHLCVNRLVKELDIQHAALIFDKASVAQETWLKRRAASFCMTHWGRVVRTDGFRKLRRSAMLDLCEEVDSEGRVVGGDELEAVGGLSGGRYGTGWRDGRKRGRANSMRSVEADETEGIDEDGMEVN
ncbi:galactose oxidase [Myriangium duriaei CBS 260.36]|uniref:Galactose oxidase n=1 Tax=Myriangium duriaei CBS 260.36 TaxID=1168546 RepID=A0A9P4J8J1_9PEZI|nr:galactose oxidase [Myriangium duriaei CBS 260.36]